jgi:hypothetical protein
VSIPIPCTPKARGREGARGRDGGRERGKEGGREAGRQGGREKRQPRYLVHLDYTYRYRHNPTQKHTQILFRFKTHTFHKKSKKNTHTPTKKKHTS